MDGVRVKEEVLSEDEDNSADDTTNGFTSDKHANPNHCMNWIKAEPLEAEAVTEYSDYPPEEDHASEGYHNKKEEQLVSVEMEEIVTVKMEDEEGDVVAQVDASHINGGITETYVCRVCGMIFTTWLNLIDHTKDCGVKKNTTTSIVNHHPTPIAVNANLHANGAPIVVYPATQVFVVSPGMMFKQNNGLPMLFKSEGSVFEASGMPSILKRESPVLQIPHMPTTLPQRPVVIAPMGNGSPPANNTLEKQFKCPKCSFSTSRAFNLKRHITIHNDASQPKAYKCTYCPYSSNLTHHLRIHMRTHTGEKPYRCTICPYAATQVANLTRHIRKHTGEKPYKCEYCPYACAHSSDLKRHIRIHTLEKPFECKLCHRCFTVGGNLKSHMKTHTGEKPYKCTLCPYACASSSNLKIHIRKHNEGQPNPVVIDEHMAALVGTTALENQSEAVTAAG